MKKILSLIVVFLTMIFSGKAQYLLQEGFETGTLPTGWTVVDSDGDGYTWDASFLYQNESTAHTGDGMIASASYINNLGALTPDNWLISPAVNLSANATLTFWVCAQDANYAAEHYGVYISTTGTATSNFTLLFEETLDANGGMRTQGAWKQKTVDLASYTGQTVYIAFRHFNCTDMFWLDLDDVEIFAQPTDPTIIANPTTLDFGTLAIGNSKESTAVLTSYNLTADVTATTAAPFYVSADGINFSSTATIAATGDTLYVRYTPTIAGTDYGIVTLSSTGADDVTVTLTGTAIDCSNTPIPYSYSFDDVGMFECWQVIDANNDGHTFTYNNGNIYYSYNYANPADDWLISPMFTFTGNEFCHFEYAVASVNYPERFQVFAFSSTDTVLLTDAIYVTSTTYMTQYIDLSNLTGPYKIAIHCISDADMYRLYITDFNITDSLAASVTVDLQSLDFGTVVLNSTSHPQNVMVTTINVNETFTVTTAAPFEISADGTTYSTSLTIPANTAIATHETFYVRYSPTTVGIHNQILTIVSSSYNDTVLLAGESVDCSDGIAVPFLEGFENDIVCWTTISMDPANDGFFRIYEDPTLAYEGNKFFLFYSNNIASDYNQYLITPELNVPDDDSYIIDFFYQGYTSDDNFKVLYSTTTADISSFIELADFQNVATSWTKASVALPSGTKYVAINYYGNNAYYLFVDNFSISLLTAPTVTINGPTFIQAGDSAQFIAESPLADSFAWTVDGVAVSTITETLTYVFTTAGNHIVSVITSNSVGSDTAYLTVEVFTCEEVHTLPFFEGFDNGLPQCWQNIDSDGDGYAWCDNINSEWNFAAYEGEGCVMSASYINSVGALYPDNWLIMPALVIPNSGATLTWFVATQDASYPSEFYEVKLSTTPNINDFTTVFSETLVSNEWEQRFVNIDGNWAGQTVYIAFQHHNVSDMYWMKIDNISVAECFPPASLTVQEVTTTSATVNWQGNNSSSYNLRYRLAGDNEWTIVTGITDLTYTISGLVAGNYEVEVAIACDSANWTPTTFTIIEVLSNANWYGYNTYNHNYYDWGRRFVSFSMQNPTVVTPATSTLLTSSGDAYTLAAAYANGYVWCITQDGDLNRATLNNSTKTISEFETIISGFENALSNSMSYNPVDGRIYYNVYNDRKLKSFDPKNPEDATEIGTYNIDVLAFAINSTGEAYCIEINTGNLYQLNLGNASTTLIGNTGRDVYYAQSMAFDLQTNELFWAQYYNYNNCGLYKVDTSTAATYYISQIGDGNGVEFTGLFMGDDVEISCSAPSELAVSNIEVHSVSLNWTENGDASEWQLCINNDTTNLISVNTTSYTLTGLATGTNYTVKVRANCNSAGHSYWSNIVTFTTKLCPAPINLEISNIAGTSALLSWTASQYEDASYTVEYSDNSATWNSMTTTETAMMLTNLMPTTHYYIRVYCNCSTGASDTLYDSFTTRCLAGGDINVGESMDTYRYLPSYSYYCHSLTEQLFTAAELGGANTFHSISFQCSSNNVPNRVWDIYLMPTMDTPLTGFVNVDTTATKVFEGTVNISTGWFTIPFDSAYVYDGISNLILIVDDNTGTWVSTNNYYVHTLSQGNSYYIYSDGTNYDPMLASTYSAYSTPYRNNVIFGGDCDSLATCITPNAIVNNITSESVTLNWVPGYTENLWEVEYCTDTANWISAGTVTTSPYSIVNLTGNTLYTFRIRSVCGSDDYSTWETLQARTECDDIAVLPYLEDFDSYGTGTYAYPSCWNSINTYTSDTYPYITSTPYSGSGSLYFYAGNNGTSNIAVVPPFSTTIPVNTLQADFMYRASNASDMLIVGVMTDPSDEDSFVAVDTVYPALTASDWDEQRVTFDQYTGNGRYIAFKNQYTTSNCSGYIDDLVIDLIETCPRPMHVVATSTPTDTVYLSWEATNGTQWDVIYGPIGFNPEDANTESTVLIQGITENHCTITGLTNGMGYDFYVRTDCGNNGFSNWSSVPATGYPYVYTMGITGSDTLTSCGFTITDNGGLNGNYSDNCDFTLVVYPSDVDSLVSVSGVFAGENSYDKLYIYDGVGVGNGELLVTLNSTAQINFGPYTSFSGPLTLYFHSDVSVINAGFEAFVSCVAAPNCPSPVKNSVVAYNIDAHNATISFTDNNPDHDSWTVYYREAYATQDDPWMAAVTSNTTVTLSNLIAETTYDAYVITNCDTLDDVADATHIIQFTTTVACPAPQNVTVSNIGMTSATVTWFSNAESFTIEYGEAGFTPGTGITETVTTNTYNLDGLTAGTNYTIYITADCGGEGFSSPASFNFNSAICEVADQCAYTFNLTDSYGDGWNGANITVQQNGVTTASVDFTAYASTSTETVMLCNNQNTVLIWNSGYYDYECGFEVISPMGNVVFSTTGTPSDTLTTFTSDCYSTVFTNPTVATTAANAITQTTATLNATITNPDNVPITAQGFEWKATTGGTYTQIAGTGTGNTFTADLTGLTPYTNYTYKAFITYNDTTVYGSEVSFKTACDSTSAVSSDPITIGTGTSSDHTFPFNNYYKNSWNEMIYPASLITETGNIVSIAFHVSAVPTSDYPFSTLTIYMGTRPDSVHSSTTSWLPMSDLTEVYSATNVSSPTDTGWLTIDLDSPFLYDGAENLVIVTSKTMATYTNALKFYYTAGPSGCSMHRRSDSDVSYANHPGSNTGTISAYRPNLQLTFTPMCGDYCYSVKNLSATNVTTSDANINWWSSESAISYIVQYKTANQAWNDEDVYTINTTDTTFYLNGLTAITTYNVRVAAYCGSDTSSWKSVNFTTPCEATWEILPYVEDFEGYTTYSVPDCWIRLQTYTNNSTVYPYINNALNTAHNGSGYLNSYGGNNFIALPCFSEPVNNLRLTFWMKPVGTTSSYGHVEVGVMSDMNNANSFQSVASWYADTIGSTEWRKYMVDFTDITPSDSDHIVIRRYVSSTYGWYFDDVTVDYLPACNAPTELTTVGATTSSVTLKWNPGEESNFKVFYKALGDEDYTEVAGAYLDADSTYTLTGLEPSTNYTVYVSSVCFDGSETAGDPITCATTMEPAELPYFTDFSENSDQSWLLNNGTCINYWTMGPISDTVAGALFVTNDGTTPGYTVGSAISMVSATKLFTIGTAPQVHIGFDVMVGGESLYDYIKLFFSPETEQYPAKAGVVPTTSEYGHNAYSLYAFDFSDYASLSTYSSATTYPYRFNLTGGNVVHIDAIMPNPHENPDDNSTAQVVFAWRNDNSGGTQPGAIISNVTINVPSCFRPENLVATNVTPQSADLSWNGGGANSWTVEYGTHGFTLGFGTIVDVTGNPGTSLTGLADNTEYDVYVKTICGDEESPNKMISFTTPCLGLTTVPQTWDMDSNLVAGTPSYLLPGCWSRISPSGTTVGYPYAYNNNTYAHSGTYSLYFYNSYPNTYAIMPYIDPAVLDIHNLQVSFFARASTASTLAFLQVGVMTDPTDTSTFTVVQTFSLTTTYDSETFDVSFADYEGNGNYIAFRNVTTGSATNSFYVDDVTLMEIPTCSKAKNLTAMPATHEADLTWTGLGSSFDLYYKAASDANYTTIQGVTLTDGYYTLTGLTAATEYSWYIVTNCDDATTFTSNIANFVTACEGLTTVPQFWNFDENLTAGTSTYPLPACWDRITTSTTTTLYPYAYSSSTYAVSSPRSLYFYNSYLNSIAVMPGIDPDVLTLTDLQITFFARLSSVNENVRLLVGVMDSPSDASSFTVVDTIALTNAHPVDPFVIKFDEYEGTGAYVAFKNISVTGTTVANSIYIDNVTLEEIPACSAPTGTQIFPAAYTADVYWENMDQGTYNVYIKTEYDSEYTVLGSLSFEDNVCTLEELEPSTTYDMYLATVCNDGSESVTNVYTFTTLCIPVIAPFVENFDAEAALPMCWEKRTGLASEAFAGVNPTTTTSGWLFTNYNVFGHNHAKLNIYSTTCNYWLITPEIDLSELSEPALVFDLALTDYNNANPIEDPTSQADDKFMVIISTDHGATWSASNATVWSNEAGATHVYNQISYTGEEVVIDLSEYAGETIRIAFYGESTASGGDNDLHIDNVVVGEMPACNAPSQLAVSDITDATATIHWTENGTATSWVVEYGTEGFTVGSGDVVTVTDTFVVLSGLQDATHYDIYVKAVCDDGSFSNPASTTFLTSCLAITLPYSQNFDSYSTGSAAEFVDCWHRFNNYSTSTNYPYVSSSYSTSGGNSLYFYNTSATYSVAVLPMIDPTVNPINTLQISFNMRTSATTSKMVVGAMTNPLDFNTFTPIDTVENTATSTFELFEVPLTSYTGNAGYVALRLLNTGTSYLAYVDDIYLETIPTCLRPTNLTVTDATTNTISVSWTPGASETTWDIIYGAPGFDPETEGTTIPSVTSNPYTITGLTSTTTYEIYVRAICGANDVSNWSNSLTASTTMVPEALPYQTDFTTDQSWLMNNGAASNYWMMGTPSGATESALFVTNDGSSAAYTITSPSVAMAEKLFTMPADDSVHVVFDVQVGGEGTSTPYDYLKVFLAPATVEFTPAAASSDAQSSYSYSENAFDFSDYLSQTGNSSYPYKLSLTQDNTLHIDMNVVNPDPNGSAKIVFLWRNDNSAGTQPGAIIRNFSIEANGSGPVVTNPTVTTTAATAVTQTTATLNATIENPDGVTVTAKGFEWKATNGGTYTQIAGTGTDNTFTADLAGLTANTNYTYKAFIIYNGTTVYGSEVSFTTLENGIPAGDALPCPGHETVTDYDGNVYNTVKIGEQCWMKENLRVTHYADGTAIPAGEGNTSNTAPYYYDYSSSGIPLEQRGYLYNWPAAMHGAASSNSNPSNVQGVCPAGWHLPSDAEWTELTNYVSSQSEYVCGGNNAKALSATEGWDASTNNCAVGNDQTDNNTTGFSAVPAGLFSGTSFHNAGHNAHFWSSSEYSTDYSIYRSLYNDHAFMSWYFHIKKDGVSIRCVLGDGCLSSMAEFSDTICAGDINYWDGQTYDQSGDYTKTFTNAAGCDSVVTLHLTVNATPAVTVTASETTLCEGGTVTLTASVEPQTAYNYQWYKIVNGVNTLVSGATSASYTTSDLLLGNSYEFYVVVTSSISGCSKISDTVPVNVAAPPTVTIQGGNTSCEGENLILNAFISGGVDGATYNYTWNWTGSTTGYFVSQTPSFIPNLSADPVNPYYFTVTISRNDNTGCTATSVAHEVNVLAVPTVTVTADNNYVCQNGDVTFTAHVSPVGSYNYVWTINGQQQAVNAATVTTSATTIGNISAQVVVSSAYAGCTATATLDNPVQVVATPTVTIYADHLTMCAGGATTLSAIVDASPMIPNNFNYEWIVDNGTPIPGVTSSYNLTLNAAGNHTVQARVTQNNLPSCMSSLSNIVNVLVAEQPVVSLNILNGSTICSGGTTTLNGVVTNYGNTVNGVTNSSIYGAMTFNWTSNGVSIIYQANMFTNQSQVDLTVNMAGNYTSQVEVTPAGYNCLPQTSNSVTFSVVNDPFWTNVSVSGSSNSHLCLGETVSLAASIQGGIFNGEGTNGHTQWVVTDGNGNTANVTSGAGGNAYDIPATSGMYVYTPTFVGDLGNGCQITNTNDVQSTVTVHELPTARFTDSNVIEMCDNDPNASAQMTVAFTGVAPFSFKVTGNDQVVIEQSSITSNTATFYVSPSVNTTYHIQQVTDSYCENSTLSTDAYASVVLVGCGEPQVITNPVDYIGSSSATCGGSVTYSGGASITARGVCWSTSQNPTVADPHTTDGNSLGEFTSTINGLTPNTNYYVRAYATNDIGISYGQEVAFTTLCDTVIVTINEAVNFNESVILTATGANSYVWSTGATTESITVSPTESTIYFVTGTNIYGCRASTSVTVTLNQMNAFDARVFPNPTTGQLHLHVTDTAVLKGNNDISVFVYDATGHLAIKTRILTPVTELSLLPYRPGIYFLEFNINGITVKKFKVVKV